MRILFVSHEFFPVVTPQSIRWNFILRELVKKFNYQVDVIIPQHEISFPYFSLYCNMDENILSSINVFYTHPGLIYKSIYKTKKNKTNVNTQKVGNIGFSVNWKHIKSFYRVNLRKFFVPDKTVDWVPVAVKAIVHQTKKRNYDYIISSGPPFSSHIACGIATKFTSCPWIADFGDPWSFASDRNLPRWRDKLDQSIEKWLFRKMNYAIFTSEMTASRYEEISTEIKQKYKIIPQAAQLEQYEQDITSEANLVVYTGSFYKNIREPWSLLAAISELPKIKLALIGTFEDEVIQFIKEKNETRNIQLIGQVKHEESIRWQLKSSVLIYIDNKESTQVPGKIFEYLAAKRLIIGIVYNNDSWLYTLAKQYPQINICFNDINSIKDTLLKVINSSKCIENPTNIYWKDRAMQVNSLLEEIALIRKELL